jgi:hypothetical protein
MDMYKGISDLKKVYQPGTDIAKSETGGLVADCHTTLATWRKYLSQLLNVHWLNYEI